MIDDTALVKVNKTVTSLASIKDVKKSSKTYLLADVSGSMEGEKLQGLTNAVRQLQFPPARIVSFSDTVMSGLATCAGGTTRLDKALVHVYNLGCQRIILISDGMPDSESQVMEVLRRNIPIDIIYITSNNDTYGKEFMERLASLTGGKSENIEGYNEESLESKLISGIKGYLK